MTTAISAATRSRPMDMKYKDKIRGAETIVKFLHVPIIDPWGTASSASPALAAATWDDLDDPNFRRILDLRGVVRMGIMGRLTANVPLTQIRVQFHTGGVITVLTTDDDWHTLNSSWGSHTADALWYEQSHTVPDGACVDGCISRVGLYGGDGVASPQITCCILHFYSEELDEEA